MLWKTRCALSCLSRWQIFLNFHWFGGALHLSIEGESWLHCLLKTGEISDQVQPKVSHHRVPLLALRKGQTVVTFSPLYVNCLSPGFKVRAFPASPIHCHQPAVRAHQSRRRGTTMIHLSMPGMSLPKVPLVTSLTR